MIRLEFSAIRNITTGARVACPTRKAWEHAGVLKGYGYCLSSVMAEPHFGHLMFVPL